MKKLLFFLLLTCTAAQAQERAAHWQGGLSLGFDWFRVAHPRSAYNVGQYLVVPRGTSPVVGFRVGGWVRHGFGRELRWLTQPEFSYTRNASYHIIDNRGDATADPNDPATRNNFNVMASAQDWQRLNLTLPVGHYFGRHWYVLGGPVVSWRIPTAYERANQDYAQRIVDSIDQSMRRLGVGAMAGVGLDVGRVSLSARYERSLMNVSSRIQLDGQHYQFRHYARQISVGMALRLAPFN